MKRRGLPALSLWNPHAGLMALGAKAVETRGQRFGIQPGPLAIASTMGVPAQWRASVTALWNKPEFQKWLTPNGWTSLEAMPRGQIVALVWVLAETEIGPIVRRAIRANYGGDEMAFGHYADGRIALTTDRDRLIRVPPGVLISGKQGVWYADQKTRDQLRAQLETHKHYSFYRDALEFVE